MWDSLGLKGSSSRYATQLLPQSIQPLLNAASSKQSSLTILSRAHSTLYPLIALLFFSYHLICCLYANTFAYLFILSTLEE